MNWQALGVIAEFLGGGAVVVSLVYLALQARQSAQVERSANYARIVDAGNNAISKVYESPEMTRLMILGSTNVDELETEDRVRFSFLMYEIFGGYEFVYEQSKAKALPDHVWPHYSQHLEFWSSLPGVRTWWNSRKAAFSSDFMEIATPYFEKLGLSVEETQETWRNF